jgi:hypothetical protein
MIEESKPSGISRRTLVKGAAWSVPVMAVGPALPAFASTPPVLEFSGTACKIPGQGQEVNKGYVLGFSINNGNAFEIEIRITGFTIDNATSTIEPLAVQFENCDTLPLDVPNGPPWRCYPPNRETKIAVYLEENGNSQNAILNLTYEVFECGTNNQLQGSTLLSVPLSGDPTTGGCEPHPGWYNTCPLPGPPDITSISPTSGPIGTAVTIFGTNLGSVNFPTETEVFMQLQGSGVINPTAVSFTSPDEVRFGVPTTLAPGVYDVLISTPFGEDRFSAFTVTAGT